MIKIKEFEKRSIENAFSREAERKKATESKASQVGKILTSGARRVIGADRAEQKVLLPLAKEKLTTVIIPWWTDFEESGLYERVFKYLSRDNFQSDINPVAEISDSIVFPWLRRISADPKDNKDTARYILQDANGNLEKAKKEARDRYTTHDEIGNLWTADFYIAGRNQFRHAPGFGISRWPINGGSFAYAMTANKNDIPLKLRNADRLLTQVHPEILIGFAEQIEDGTVTKNLESSIKQRRSTSTLKPSSSSERVQAGEALAEEYWSKKKSRLDGLKKGSR